MVEKARASTQARVATVETELPKLRNSCKELQETVQGYRDQEQRVRNSSICRHVEHLILRRLCMASPSCSARSHGAAGRRRPFWRRRTPSNSTLTFSRVKTRLPGKTR